MKERGMVFTQSLIPHLLSGEKTQTRRLMKRQPPAGESTWGNDCGRASCHAGDLIWVREAWRTFKKYDNLTPSLFANLTVLNGASLGIGYEASRAEWVWGFDGRYRNARFMPKRFARIWLKVLGVRPERVRDITKADAVAEGVEPIGDWSCRWNFAHIWDRLHKPPNAWADNPWVWRIKFERTERP